MYKERAEGDVRSPVASLVRDVRSVWSREQHARIRRRRGDCFPVFALDPVRRVVEIVTNAAAETVLPLADEGITAILLDHFPHETVALDVSTSDF